MLLSSQRDIFENSVMYRIFEEICLLILFYRCLIVHIYLYISCNICSKLFNSNRLPIASVDDRERKIELCIVVCMLRNRLQYIVRKKARKHLIRSHEIWCIWSSIDKIIGDFYRRKLRYLPELRRRLFRLLCRSRVLIDVIRVIWHAISIHSSIILVNWGDRRRDCWSIAVDRRKKRCL